MKNLLVIILVLLATGLSAGNSIFSYYGFPCQNYGKDIYSLGMGDTGSSDIFRYNTGYANPALHNRNNRTLFATGLIMGYTWYDSEFEGAEENYRDDVLDFPYFNVSLPVNNHRFGIQFNSYASGVVTNQHALPDSSIEIQVADKYLYKADLIYSANFGTYNAGISGNFYFGHDNRKFAQTGNYGGFDTEEKLIKDFKNIGFTLGILKSWKKLAVGAHYTPAITLKGESTRQTIHQTEESQDYEFKLPHQINVGITVLPHPQFKVATDLTYETHEEINSSYRNTLKAGLGLAYEPDPELHRSAFMKLPMRTGISYRQLAFPDRDGNDIDELALSMGITFPLKRDVNRIDLGLQYLKRGNLDTNGLSDTSLMLMLGFTGFDIISRAKDNTRPREIPVKEETE